MHLVLVTEKNGFKKCHKNKNTECECILVITYYFIMNQQISNVDRTIPSLSSIPYQIDHEKIVKPNCNDVLLGRGNFAKRWSGNQFYRYLIQNKKYEYVVADPSQKLPIALEIIDMVRSLSPPGRFLVKNKKTGLWCKVDDKLLA